MYGLVEEFFRIMDQANVNVFVQNNSLLSVKASEPWVARHNVHIQTTVADDVSVSIVDTLCVFTLQLFSVCW